MIEKPTIFNEGDKKLSTLKKEKGINVVDIYEAQAKELFEVENPGKKFEGKPKSDGGSWVYYPWSNVLLHTVGEADNDLLRTNRNKNIITEEEQKKIANFTIAIAGLSVGGNIATTLVYNGFPKNIKLADFDRLQTTNLNRVRAKLSDVGEFKLNIISRQLYELDPYIKMTSFDRGLNKSNIKKFLDGTKLVFEIIDDLELKILLRKEAKQHKIPVVMLTSIGDSVMVDIERHDTDPKAKVFNGLVTEEILEDILQGKVSKEDVNKYVLQIVGEQNVPPKVLESIKQIGKTLVSRPQLMNTVTVASGIACFVARKIALGEALPSGRSIFKFDDLFKNSL